MDHRAAGFPTTCETCHSVNNWQLARFDHNQFAKFPLTGAHATVLCASCHVGGHYQGTVATCAGCHSKDFATTTNPNHVAAGFPQTCETCHNTVQWLGATFDHSTTKFPLTGKHTTVACAQCHTNGQYATLPTTCVSCHLPDYQKTTTPNHVAASFPQTCETCPQHDAVAGRDVRSQHHQVSADRQAHDRRLRDVPCQRPVRDAADDLRVLPPAGLSENDDSEPRRGQLPAGPARLCHNTDAWLGAVFNHNTHQVPADRKAYDGRLRDVPRQRPVRDPADDLRLVPPDRIFRRPRAPNHVAARFPQTCETCHNTTQWLGAAFNHSTTKFPLTGKHTTVACATCHVNGQYATLPTTCVSCHLPDYQKTTTPNHVAASFPQTCETCHNTDAVARSDVQSQHDEVSADRKAHDRRLRDLPRQRPVRDPADDLRLVPPAGLPEDDESEPRRGEFPADLRDLPQHDAVAGRDVQSQHDQVPADRQAHDGRLRAPATSTASTRPCRRPACRATCRTYQKTTNPNHVAAGSRRPARPATTPRSGSGRRSITTRRSFR